MTLHLSIVLFLPLASGVLGLLAPPRVAARLALLGTALVLGYAVAYIVDFDSSASGLQYVTDDTWIRELGISYKLGIDGLNLFLVALTGILFFFCTLWANLREWERPRLFYFHFMLAETAVLGALLAQDLALFVVFFDLMLVPFFFLTGQWGEGRRVQATMKLVIYTLVGSLLMLTAAIATGVLAASGPAELSFAFSDLAQHPLAESSQNWIFLFFAAAFLVKMPAFPLHGWMPDGYRSMPLPVLAVFSGVLSKVAAYGFLRICLPLFPDASQNFQMLLLLVALASILYGSAMAFTTTETRLILGYSSVAQLGFITLGIFALNDRGAQGAILQAFNHGLVVAPAFFIVALLAARAGGSQDIRDMGGIGMRAPVLASMFLIVTFATLAMPGSSNFVGEFYILLGVFTEKIVIAIVATAGVVLASVYALRLYIGSVHNRTGPRVESRELSLGEGLVLVPLVLLVLAIALYPQFALKRSDRTVTSLTSPAPELVSDLGRATPQIQPGATPYAPLEETP
ncbi:MAG: NADH-quinone oxidoreductase subunit [Solirubrobacteraceae bacterium]|jgi:NADH-quinone oxidoreductase subunit M|nr:NADH-quinone oxidoreductase subunit [Solirubrobacteraceae bacterium]